MTLELGDLRYFMEVKARGTLTAAARSLGVSQPSLTAAMQRLEKHFETTLLLRDHTGVKLTATGRALAFDAEELFELLEAQLAEVDVDLKYSAPGETEDEEEEEDEPEEDEEVDFEVEGGGGGEEEL